MERILVIGANGQIGSELVEALSVKYGADNVVLAPHGAFDDDLVEMRDHPDQRGRQHSGAHRPARPQPQSPGDHPGASAWEMDHIAEHREVILSSPTSKLMQERMVVE